jgi:hypothetical protein
MEVVVAGEVPTWKQNKAGSVRPGATIRQWLFKEEAPDGLNFKVFRSQFQPGAAASTTPRHHHAFQQVRWAEAGEVNYAPGKNIPAGDVAYFPRGAYYGPQLKDRGISIALQLGFGGEHQHGRGWDSLQGQAMERLKARGSFENGVFVEIDPDTGERRENDSVQAVYEEQYAIQTGKKFVVPDEGYDEPILMHPAAFEYYEIAPGVEVKQLGCFFDHAGPNADLRLSMIRLTDGAAYTFGPERGQIAWTRDAGLVVDGKTYPELTYVYIPRDEKAEISSATTVELNIAEFPRLD